MLAACHASSGGPAKHVDDEVDAAEPESVPQADAARADSASKGDRGSPDLSAAPADAEPQPVRDASKSEERDARAPIDSARGGPVAGALDHYVFSVACPTRTTDDQCDVPDAMRLKTAAPLQIGGDPAVTYRVRVHFCGPVEGRKYTGCARTPFSNDSLLCMDGTPAPMTGADQFVDTYPTYEMKVSAPAHSYFVNSRDLRDTLMKIDYSAELEVKGGATIVFSTTSRGTITFTSRKLQPPITCPDVPGLTQPFNGQFIHVTVESTTPE